MSVVPVPQRLEPLDAAFLLGETPDHPLHVGAICVFEGAALTDSSGRLRYDDLCEHVEARLHRVPRLRHKVLPVPFSLGRPVWVEDGHFDARAHLRRAALPSPGRWDQMLELFAEIQARPLERDRPLWELWTVEGLEGDRVAVVPKIHHALGDGVSIVDLAMLLLDPTPQPYPVEPELDHEIPPEPTALARLTHAAIDTAGELAGLARSATALLRDPRGSAAGAATVGRTMAATLRLTAPSPLKGRIGPKRRVETLEVSLDDLKEIRRSHGVTLNDVVLCAVAAGIRQLLSASTMPARPLRALVPVNMRGPDGSHGAGGGLMGNRVSLLLADLVVDAADHSERLHRINAEMSARKAEREAHHADSVLGVTRWLPPPVLAGVARLLMTTQPFASVLVTNVAGPPVPLYFQGARMTAVYPYLGSLAGMGLVVAVASYEGSMGFTFTADPGIVADVVAVREGVDKCIGDLLAGVS